MSLFSKFITSGLTFGLALCLSTASFAAEQGKEKEIEKTSDADAILFRIENIKPLTNEDGLTDRCSFLVTVYNRMEKKVDKIDMDFRWMDAIEKKYQIVDDSVRVVNDIRDAETYIIKHIELEDVFPHQQKSFAEEVETDKCFLLLDQLEYKVNDCIAEGDKIEMKNNKKTSRGSCVDRFNYINSKNPEYYSEFKDVPDSVLEKQAEESKAHELAGVEKAYKSALDDLTAVSKELDKIAKYEPEKKEDKDAKNNATKDKSDKKDDADKEDKKAE
ncbi:MAG: hypothetical protein IJS88_04880 [Alphaproteobacteria bacterium]|nr:hypothetical protein [Alphaproteobacteria bacterium]